ncbi:cupin domain-containing protein [Brevibacillus laterosporus]|uniref:cupin domain-containing protein n=1 Tax=Brevibacillus laterosporus TaxID=1465 RepID=UPI00264D040F|nr:cupin [Brevibacillus laterosporus]MDN9012109.1 cupin [Brevibacillus laterosporus]MDO0943146.1 cupin [Brevibacillus laterosporus]
MKRFSFALTYGKSITHYDSLHLIMSRIGKLPADTYMNCAYLSPQGKIGYHQATLPQLLLVLSGDGWVRTDTSDYVYVQSGDAVYWDSGEWHETITESGMVSIILEANDLFRRISMLEYTEEGNSHT